MIEEEAQKRVELLIKKRVDTLLETQKQDIENEIKRRVSKKEINFKSYDLINPNDYFDQLINFYYFKVDAVKQEMERELMKELEKRREERLNEEKKREVCIVCTGLVVI